MVNLEMNRHQHLLLLGRSYALSVVRLSARDRTHPLWGDLQPLAAVHGIEQFSEWVTASGRS